MYRFVPMISAEEISLPKDRRCLRFKCNSFYELNAVNTLPVHDLSAVNDCILRFKYSSTVIIEDEPVAAQYLAELLDDTCQVEVVGSATESEAGLRLCAELRPDAVFVDINLPGQDGVSLAKQLAMLPQPPRLVFTTGNANRATDAFRLEAVDYLLKPLDPEQVTEAVKRLLAYLRPFEAGSSPGSGGHANRVPTTDKMRSTGM